MNYNSLGQFSNSLGRYFLFTVFDMTCSFVSILRCKKIGRENINQASVNFQICDKISLEEGNALLQLLPKRVPRKQVLICLIFCLILHIHNKFHLQDLLVHVRRRVLAKSPQLVRANNSTQLKHRALRRFQKNYVMLQHKQQ